MMSAQSPQSIAAGPIGVVGAEQPENAGAMREIMHQGVDRDHHRAGFDPGRLLRIASEQQLEQRHRQQLVRHA